MKPANRFKMMAYLVIICVVFVGLVNLVVISIPYPYSIIFYAACILCLALAFLLWLGFLEI